MRTKPRVLILGAGAYYLRMIETAKRLGMFVLAADKNPAAPGLAAADVGRAVDIVDADGVLALAREFAVDAVVPINDFGVLTAAAVSRTLGLPGQKPEAALLGVNKCAMRQRWKQRGLGQPRFRSVHTLEEAYAAARELGVWPLICKPAESRGGGSRGVSRVDSPDQLERAMAFAQSFYEDREVLLEECAVGLEHSVETMTVGGVVHVLAVSDKEKTVGRYRVDRSVIYPSRLSGEELDRVETAVRQAVLALGVQWGPAHVELCSTGSGASLFELGLRCGGGGTPDPIVPYVTGIDMVAALLRLHLGLDPGPLTPTRSRGCVYRFLMPEPGTVTRVEGLDRVRAEPGILDAGVFVRPGDVVRPVRTGADRSGYVIAGGKDAREALERADRAENLLQVFTRQAGERYAQE